MLYEVITLRFIKVKHRTEKELAQKKRDIERSKNLDIIDLKNKELTTNALQLVEKEKLLKELKSILFDSKKEVEKSELKKIFKKLTNNSNNYWKEFEMRLVEVNEDFYKVLKSNYPDLTPGELKMCAFVRLNYSSKEIANLLGIGVESVHSLSRITSYNVCYTKLLRNPRLSTPLVNNTKAFSFAAFTSVTAIS